MKKIAIFASGSGTNTERIINYFKFSEDVSVSAVFTNNPNAYVIKRAENHKIPYFIFNKDEFYRSDIIEKKLIDLDVDLIVLAGFLWLVPDNLIKQFPSAIINIHPALLPKYGGKGMYGQYVHEAVKTAGETETGITIHYVNEKYDDGNIIFQAKCQISQDDTPDSIAKKVHELEYRHFPEQINKLLKH